MDWPKQFARLFEHVHVHILKRKEALTGETESPIEIVDPSRPLISCLHVSKKYVEKHSICMHFYSIFTLILFNFYLILFRKNKKNKINLNIIIYYLNIDLNSIFWIWK